MKVFKIVFALFLLSFVTIACSTEAKKDKTKEVPTTQIAHAETLALNVSGMSCEIGCAKTIESKLAKKEGVLDAKVVFNDSIATIKYDGDKLQKADLISFVESIGDGETYKASESSKKECKAGSKEDCCKDKGDKKACNESTKKECCTTEKA